MCESLEVARILDVSETLRKTRCRQNSAIPSLSIMAKIRMPEKIEMKPAATPLKIEQRVPLTPTKMSSSLDSSSSGSYSSSPETNDSKFPLDLNEIIGGVNNIVLKNTVDDEVVKSSDRKVNYVCNKNIVESDDEKSDKCSEKDDDRVHSFNFVFKRNNFSDEKSEKSSDDDDDVESVRYVDKSNILPLDDDESDNSSDKADEDDDYCEFSRKWVEKGPVRPPLHHPNRSKPYVESAHQWPSLGIVPAQPPLSDNSTDYDTSAKAILTDQSYSQTIGLCLDQLSDMGQDQSIANSLSPGDSDYGGASNYSPQQPHHWQPDQSPNSVRSAGSSTCFVPSITVCNSESSLLEKICCGGFLPAQAPAQTPEYNSGASTAAYDNWADSPTSSYNACATSASRPDSRASSRAHSPGSNNGGCASGGAFLNVIGSPLGSPQVSPQQNFRNHHRPSSSSSSSQSYCETPSPANYQNPLDQHTEEKLGDHMMSRMPAWRDSFESSDTLVNSLDSRELQLQLVEEVIRSEMKEQPKTSDMQVVPNCRNNPPSTSTSTFTISNPSPVIPSDNYPCAETVEPTDDLTNTLLRFVGSEQAIPPHRKVEARSNSSTTSGYSSCSSSNEARKLSQDSNCLPLDQPLKTTFLGSLRSPPRPQPQQSVYQQSCMSLSPAIGTEALHFPTSPVELVGTTTWQKFPEPNNVVGNLTSSNNFADFQIAETVESYNSRMAKTSCKNSLGKSNSGERTIAPWPSLNLPSTRACERLKEVTDPREVEKAMQNLLKQPLDELAKTDDDGDTVLMCLSGNPKELSKKLAWLAPLVERLAAYENSLATLNNRGEDALYLAAMNCPQMAFVAGYLAAAFLQKNIDIGQRLYRSRGDTLVHALAAKGDTHGEVLAELLSLKTAQGNSVFDLSKRNYDGRTALHVAVDAHETSARYSRTLCLGTVRLLMENGADPLIREVRCGDTALHMAVSLTGDPSLVKLLLVGRGREAVNVPNYNGNTPLHMIAAMSDRISIDRLTDVCWALIHAGGRTNITNRQGKAPLALVSSERKEILRRIFHRKS